MLIGYRTLFQIKSDEIKDEETKEFIKDIQDEYKLDPFGCIGGLIIISLLWPIVLPAEIMLSITKWLKK